MALSLKLDEMLLRPSVSDLAKKSDEPARVGNRASAFAVNRAVIQGQGELNEALRNEIDNLLAFTLRAVVITTSELNSTY
jgi:hypothetical protein